MKNKKWFRCGFLFMMGVSIMAQSHEGHDHGAVGVVAAPRGGVLKASFGTYFELLKSGNLIKIHPYDAKLKALPLEALTEIEATANIPRGSSERLVVTKQVDHFTMNFDPKKSHRFVLVFKYKVQGKLDSVDFNVEKN